jgi:hypothetical protein
MKVATEAQRTQRRAESENFMSSRQDPKSAEETHAHELLRGLSVFAREIGFLCVLRASVANGVLK